MCLLPPTLLLLLLLVLLVSLQLPFKPLLRLRHHCRLCGKLFCNSCSNKQLLLPPRFKERCVRGGVCVKCIIHHQVVR
jgi:hypothetical protein